MNKPVRVLQVFAQMNRGGAETMIMNLYRNIDRSKIQFDFVVHTNEKCAFDDEIIALGGIIHRVPRYTGFNHFHYIKEWSNFFKQNSDYKIVHGHVRSTASLYLAVAKKNSILTIAHSHSSSYEAGVSGFVKKIMQFPIKNIAHYLFACSISAGEWLFGQVACQKDNFFVLNNSINIQNFSFNSSIRNDTRKAMGLADKYVIGNVSRFSTPKNHKFLVNIFREISREIDNAVLLLVGDGELREEISRQVNDLGLKEKVIFAGIHSDVSNHLNAMDLFVFPSLYEGLGIAIIEAQAAGLPCIISDTIPREVLLTDLIYSLPLDNSEAWVKQIVYCSEIKNNQRSTGYAAQVKAKGYDIIGTARWLEKFYLNIIHL